MIQTSFSLRRGVLPMKKAYLNVIVAACMSKQHETSKKIKDFCSDFAYHLMRSQNLAPFQFNGFLKSEPEDSDVPNWVQRKVSNFSFNLGASH
jgi:hypothetical protein